MPKLVASIELRIGPLESRGPKKVNRHQQPARLEALEDALKRHLQILNMVKRGLGKDHIKEVTSKVTSVHIFLQEINNPSALLRRQCKPLCDMLWGKFQNCDSRKNSLRQQLPFKTTITTTKTECVASCALRVVFFRKVKKFSVSHPRE